MGLDENQEEEGKGHSRTKKSKKIKLTGIKAVPEGFSIDIRIPGDPIPKQSFRASSEGGYQTDRIKDYAKLVGLYALRSYKGDLLELPLALFIFFNYRRPKKHWRTNGELKDWAKEEEWHAIPPDEDNVKKMFKDALEGIIYVNDMFVVHTSTFSLWSNEKDGFVLAKILPAPKGISEIKNGDFRGALEFILELL